jgi:hypothetical protein
MGNILIYYRAVGLSGFAGCRTIFPKGVKPDIKDIILEL